MLTKLFLEELYNYTMSPNSKSETLLDLGARCRWNAVLSRAETHPEELELRSNCDGGMTIFHFVFANMAPIQVLRDLLARDERRASQGHARAVLIPDYNGVTPLMMACSLGPQARLPKYLPFMLYIADSAPESIPITDNDGWTALHYVCHESCTNLYYAVPLVYAFLRRSRAENRRLIFQSDASGMITPISLVCDTNGLSDGICSQQTLDKRSVGRCVRFVTLMLDKVISPDMALWSDVSRLLSFSEIPCAFVDIMLSGEKEDNVLLTNDRGDNALHVTVSKPWKQGVVKRVVQACPAAASIRNLQGLLPLQMAIATRNQHWDEDFCALVTANPESLEQAFELDDWIYAYVLERISNHHDGVFRLLKSKPSLVHRRI